MKSPEQRARHRAVVARVTQVQKTQQLFVDEVKPEKAVILAGPAVHRERKVRRIAQRCQHVPWDGNRQRYEDSAEQVQTLPSPDGK